MDITPLRRALSSPRVDSALLVAQPVPTAERIPCTAGYPMGWTLASAEVRSGHTSFVLRSDRAGAGVLQVILEAACETTGGQEVATDEPGTARHDLRVRNGARFREVRAYARALSSGRVHL